MIKKIILTALSSLALGAVASAQSGALPVLGLQQDVRATAMGGVYPTDGGGHLYSVPTDVFVGCCQTKLRLHTTLGLTPERGELSSQMATIAGSYRMNRHALLVGARYLGFGAQDYVGSGGMVRGRIHPRDWTVDLGYAYSISKALAVYARGGFVQSYNSLNADVLTFSLGGSYRTGFYKGDRMMASLLATLSLDNLGGKYHYGKTGAKHDLPTSATASLAVSLLKRQSLTLGVRATTFLKADGGERATILGVGAQYRIGRVLALRGGYTHQSDVEVWSLGLGARLGQCQLDAGYDLHSVRAFSYLRLGLSLAL